MVNGADYEDGLFSVLVSITIFCTFKSVNYVLLLMSEKHPRFVSKVVSYSLLTFFMVE